MKLLLSVLSLVALLATPVAAIEIQPVTSPEGRQAWLVEEGSIPFVSIQVIFTGGSSLDPEGKAGAMSLMTALLNEGAGDLDSQAYATALESLAGTISFEAGRDQVSMTIRALTENRDQVIDLAMLALTQARLDDDSIDRVRAQMIASQERQARNPSSIARRAFAELGFAGHPYATPTDGTPESIAGLTSEDVRNAYRAAFTRDLVYVGAAGDISAQDLGAIVDRIVGALPASNTPLPAYRSFDAPPGITVIDFPAPQSVIQFGHAGMRWDDDDFMTAYVINSAFGGGGFNSSLMQELREQRGLTYGVYTGLASNRFGDSFAGSFSTANETVAQAIDLVRAQFEWLANGGMTQEDLDRIQTYLTGAYALRFDGNESIAQILASMQFQGYPLNYINIRNDLIRAITLDDVRRVSARLAQPDALQFVVVGQPVGLD